MITIGEYLPTLARYLGKRNKLGICCRSSGGRNAAFNIIFQYKSESLIFPFIIPCRKFFVAC